MVEKRDEGLTFVLYSRSTTTRSFSKPRHSADKETVLVQARLLCLLQDTTVLSDKEIAIPFRSVAVTQWCPNPAAPHTIEAYPVSVSNRSTWKLEERIEHSKRRW
jgi:hypothetical protein